MSKLTEELKCLVDEDTRDDFIALARINGQKPGDFLRRMIRKELYGSIASLSDAAKVNNMAEIGQE